jgi:hypothetical protein
MKKARNFLILVLLLGACAFAVKMFWPTVTHDRDVEVRIDSTGVHTLSKANDSLRSTLGIILIDRNDFKAKYAQTRRALLKLLENMKTVDSSSTDSVSLPVQRFTQTFESTTFFSNGLTRTYVDTVSGESFGLVPIGIHLALADRSYPCIDSIITDTKIIHRVDFDLLTIVALVFTGIGVLVAYALMGGAHG